MDPSVVNPPFPVATQFQPTPAPAFVPAPAPPPAVASPPPVYAVNPVANPSPVPNYGNTPNHPPYTEMITSAILALREKDGSSKKAISKYIDRVYTDLPPAHPALLTHHLKRLKNSGHLVMIKKSYAIAGSDAAAAAATTTPGSDFAPVSASESPVTAATSSAPKRRGRPPKHSAPPLQAVFAPEQDDTVQPSLAVSAPPSEADLSVNAGLGNGAITPKRRGRPPKRKVLDPAAVSATNPDTSVSGLVNGSISAKRRPGRPPKSLSVVTFGVPDASASEKRRPGRLPQKLGAVTSPSPSGRPRGRPRKNAVAAPTNQQTVSFSDAAGEFKRRGRPPKNRYLEDGGVAVVGMKRRGRPPKRGGAQMMPRMWKSLGVGRGRGRGRLVGRPRKDSTLDSHDAAQLVVASEEMTRKLEYMQLKVKKAVGLLRPHVSNLDNLDIMTAMEDLQELTEMDLKPTATQTEASTGPSVDAIAPMVDASMEGTAGEGAAAAAVVELSASKPVTNMPVVIEQESQGGN